MTKMLHKMMNWISLHKYRIISKSGPSNSKMYSAKKYFVLSAIYFHVNRWISHIPFGLYKNLITDTQSSAEKIFFSAGRYLHNNCHNKGSIASKNSIKMYVHNKKMTKPKSQPCNVFNCIFREHSKLSSG